MWLMSAAIAWSPLLPRAHFAQGSANLWRFRHSRQLCIQAGLCAQHASTRSTCSNMHSMHQCLPRMTLCYGTVPQLGLQAAY